MRKKVRPEILLEIQHAQDYRTRIQLLRSEYNLITYCTDCMPNGFAATDELPILPFSLNLITDTIDLGELAVFEALLKEDIRSFSDLMLKNMPFEKKLLICSEILGHLERYLIKFSDGSISKLGIEPRGRYEVETFNSFYLSQYTKAHTTQKSNGFSLIISSEVRKQRLIDNLILQDFNSSFIEKELELVHSQMRSNKTIEELTHFYLENRSGSVDVSAWDSKQFVARAVAIELADYIRFLRQPFSELFDLCQQVVQRREIADSIIKERDFENKLNIYTSHYELLLSDGFIFPGGDEKRFGPAFYRYLHRSPINQQELEEKQIYLAYLEKEVRTLSVLIESKFDPMERLSILFRYFGKEMCGRFDFDSRRYHIHFSPANKQEIGLYNKFLTEKMRPDFYKKAIPMVYQLVSFEERMAKFEYLQQQGISTEEIIATENMILTAEAQSHAQVFKILQQLKKGKFDLCDKLWSQEHCGSYIFATDIFRYQQYLSNIQA